MIEFTSMNGGVRDARLHYVRYFCAVGRLADLDGAIGIFNTGTEDVPVYIGTKN